MAEIEKSLRNDEGLRKRLAAVMGRRDAGVHSLAEIWRTHRVTCPSRDEWGAYLMGVCPEDQEDYYRFHLDELGCRWCQANVQDLKDRAERHTDVEVHQRRTRYFQSSIGHMKPFESRPPS